MKYGSVCSGIEAASVAWESLGWQAAWFSEIEPFPCAVLSHHWPEIPNHGDMTMIADRVKAGAVEAPDVLVGGTPCQAFSVAGLRGGMSDQRGALTIHFLRLANEIDAARHIRGEQPAIILWENVPGVLSSKDNAFGCFLAGLAGEDYPLQPPRGRWSDAGCVYGPKRSVAWRILDAQYFGLAQRRRRVFVVASARDGFNPAEILFEFDGLRRDTPPRREAGKEVAGTISSRTTGGGGLGTDFECSGGLQAWPAETASTLNASFGSKLGLENQHINSGAPLFVPAYGIPGNWIGRKPENGGNAVEPMVDVSPCQTTTDRHGVAYAFDSLASNSMKSNNPVSGCRAVDLAKTIDTTTPCPSKNQGGIGILQSMAVRRLTPTECERLQGFPDGYTLVPHRGKPSADGPRYKSLGNSMAVPVMRWIGERIQAVENHNI